VIEAYGGSCHCGRVRFRVRFSPNQTSFKCNCTVCSKTRAWLAPVGADAVTLLSNEADLHSYQFGARSIEHRFCAHCGVKVFGKGTDGEGNPLFAVSLAALDDLPPARLAELPIQYFNGRHDDYANPPSDTSLL
jgi:hypothetical protein